MKICLLGWMAGMVWREGFLGLSKDAFRSTGEKQSKVDVPDSISQLYLEKC